MSVHDAVLPGTNLTDHARALVRTHHTVLGGGRPALRPRAVVARSWSRVIRLGLDATASNARDPLRPDELERRRRASPLGEVIDELRLVVGSVGDASQLLLVVTDADGVVLWREGTASVRRQADALGFGEGSRWSEEVVGTNAIGTAIVEAAPVQLFSAEHFEQAQHPWYCTASPVHDPRTGQLLGVIDVSGPALTLHPAVGALVEAARRLAEARLRHYHEQRLERLRRSAAPVLATVRGPMLLVDEHGWVAQSSGIAVGARIAAPAADLALTVPGLGLCLPERLADGWLVRPSGRAHEVAVTLDLSREPMVEVCAGDASWRRPLSTRHAEIVLLLHLAGPAGLTADALSRALFGDAEHVVAVRAEVSRLRRSLGTLVDTRPYRLARGVRSTLRLDPGRELAGCQLVRTSTSPGIRSLACRASTAVRPG